MLRRLWQQQKSTKSDELIQRLIKLSWFKLPEIINKLQKENIRIENVDKFENK
jgi:hypothetical protein